MKKIDFNDMEEYLDSISYENNFSFTDYEISKDEFEKICEMTRKYGMGKIKKYFYHLGKNDAIQKFNLKLTCNDCGKKIKVVMLREQLLESVVRNLINDFSCNCYPCVEKKKYEKEKNDELIQKENHNIALEIMEKLLINPNAHWNKDVNVSKKIKEIETYLSFVETSQVKELIKKLEYKEFLATPYWKAIAEYKKNQHKKCQLCGSIENLNVHHSNYRILGEEIFKMQELTVLCDKCHNKFHKGGDE